ncbi:hypothetical protein HNR65_003342 [Desulfosalsimonas propionicica]|uniref:DNA-binding protein n=1 Tax=Desulfosalsimonas propionicica TaxID=332175 RepID=A0A7W0CC13_9BACT|nr:Zn-ribbon domain-containing OB-fold protein [Desulfosalsimonas propionicica]MBA2882986.1 hypothetical protein [Desulfosalsimonas propionicica]
MSEYNKPLPLVTELSKHFYDGCKQGELLYQKCDDCGQIVFYPKELCPACMGRRLSWRKSNGKGKIYTFTVTYDAAPPEFATDVPYALALIDVDEGFRMMSNIVECDFDKLRCEMPVEVVFDQITPDIALPKFRPSEPDEQ